MSWTNAVPLEPLEEETLLPDDYPVYWDYLYWVDSRIERSDVQGTVGMLRTCIIHDGRSAREVRRCDFLTRGDLMLKKEPQA